MRTLIPFLLAVTMLAGCRFPSTSEILSGNEDVAINNGYVEVDINDIKLDCHGDLRKAHKPGIMTYISKSHYEYDEVGWFAVGIKHSSRFPKESWSNAISIIADINIEILEAVGAELLPYRRDTPKSAPYWLPRSPQSYRVELDHDYRALIKFRYLATEHDENALDNHRGGKIPFGVIDIRYSYVGEFFSYGDSGGFAFADGMTLAWVEADRYCDPALWNTIPDDGTELYPFYIGRKFTDEELEKYRAAETSRERELVLWEIIWKEREDDD